MKTDTDDTFNKTAYIVTHNDVDGVVSNALLRRYYLDLGFEVDSRTVNYKVLTKTIQSLELEGGDILAIADIGYNESLKSLFDKHKGILSSESLYIYDHHDWPKEKLSELLGVDGSCIAYKKDSQGKVCASEIIQRELFPNDVIASYLAGVAHANDFEDGINSEEYRYGLKLEDLIVSRYGGGKIETRQECDDIITFLSEVESLPDDVSIQNHLWNDESDEACQIYQQKKKDALERMKGTLRTYRASDECPAMTFALAPYDIGSKAVRREIRSAVSDTEVIFVIWPGYSFSFEIVDPDKPGRRSIYNRLYKRIKDNFKGGGRCPAGGGTFEGVLIDDLGIAVIPNDMVENPDLLYKQIVNIFTS